MPGTLFCRRHFVVAGSLLGACLVSGILLATPAAARDLGTLYLDVPVPGGPLTVTPSNIVTGAATGDTFGIGALSLLPIGAGADGIGLEDPTGFVSASYDPTPCVSTSTLYIECMTASSSALLGIPHPFKILGTPTEVGVVVNITNNFDRVLLATLIFRSSPASSSSDVDQTHPLTPSIVQQFAKPTIGTCLAAAPTSLNWSGVSSGGWGESWAQWPNGGAGGPVCTRTLTYSAAQSAWVVG